MAEDDLPRSLRYNILTPDINSVANALIQNVGDRQREGEREVSGFPPEGRRSVLKQVMMDLLDKRYQSVLADNEQFHQNPVRHVAGNLLFGAQALGAGAAPGARPILNRGAAPPAGDFLQPRSPSMPPEGVYTPQGYMARTVDRASPVEGMKEFAQTNQFLDPKRVASTYRNIYPEAGEAAAKLESIPPVTEMSPMPEAAAILRRNQRLIDAMSNPENLGPWGMRNAAGQ